jgi:hypothetical protein
LDGLIGWGMALQALQPRGRLFRRGVDTALAPCNHSLTLLYVDVSMRIHDIVKNKEGKLLTNQRTVIVDKTIRKTTLVRAAEQQTVGVHEYVDALLQNCLQIMFQ